jgi:hypothetical protein
MVAVSSIVLIGRRQAATVRRAVLSLPILRSYLAMQVATAAGGSTSIWRAAGCCCMLQFVQWPCKHSAQDHG